mgnify:CR=1 FL=1
MMKKQQSIYELNRIQQYIMQMRPILRKRALFSDGTEDYRSPAEPKAGELVTIRFRTARDNVDAVWLCTEQKKYFMEKTESEGLFDYYSVEIRMTEEHFSYYFEIETGMLRCIFDRYGVNQTPRPQYNFEIVPGFSTPDWAKGAVMYQILTDRFYNGDTSNDPLTDEYFYIRTTSQKVDNWEKCPENFSVAEFYGGDLEGVRKKMDYLAELGIEVIYFNPLFVSPSNHKYDIQDYDYIDPHYGKIVVDEGELLQLGDRNNQHASRYITRVTDKRNLEASNELFATLVKEAHQRGIRVILDGVFNHCGSFNKWLDREKIYRSEAGYEPGAYISKDSPYNDFFQFHDQNAWPDNGSYDGWWGHDTLPKLNYEGSKELEEYMKSIFTNDFLSQDSIEKKFVNYNGKLAVCDDYDLAQIPYFTGYVGEYYPDDFCSVRYYLKNKTEAQVNFVMIAYYNPNETYEEHDEYSYDDMNKVEYEMQLVKVGDVWRVNKYHSPELG